MMLKKLQQTLTQKNNIWLILLLVCGSLAWSLTMVKSGLCWGGSCANGIGFWGPNGHDGVWHIAVIESLARGSLGMPIFAGATLSNYHFGFDLLAAFIHKLTFIPVQTLYFQIIPPILALGVGITCYRFVKDWKKSELAALWATFFIYFGGSFGWFVNLIRGNAPLGESMFWSQQSISTLINPPFALSLIIIFVAMDILRRSLKSKNKKSLGLVTVLFGLLIIVKVYAGLLILGGLFIAGIFQVLRARDFRLFKVFGGVLILSLLLLLPTIDVSRSLIEYKPFWFLETMMVFSDRVGWDRFYSAMTTYKQGGLWLKMVIFYIVAFVIFIVGNLGTRAIGLLYIANKPGKPKKLDYLDFIILSLIGLGIIVPLVFVQRGTPWNTIQFFYYSLMFMGVLTGIVVGAWIRKLNTPLYRIIISLVIIMFTIPTTLATLYYHYLPSRPPAMLDAAEVEALEFLRNQPDGVVLTYPFDQETAQLAIANPPRPLRLYESTAYVSAYSNKDVYLEDEVNLNITGFDWQTRRERVLDVFRSKDPGSMLRFIRKNNIKYVFLTADESENIDDSSLEKLFDNGEVHVYGF